VKRPGIPAIPLDIDPKIRAVLLPLKQNVELTNGVLGGTTANQTGWLQQAVTLDMLVQLGLITEAQARSVYQEL